ncbi:nucleotidyl transferase AbiEii/AbiGii toxin family protein [Listeria monocytogenes]|uniref:nucleotidyl transferase AbiEii/AbiGii toxin family protein n=1 Tax=Listeria monocytogenes TaxID=1639 RepID=UPI0011EB5C3A|nr:nucleotidyl transferase AbiEii/AbiGii toxin family protein [Listeria monocytogenes]EAF1795625.1 nucleotidyl transferase AbiEii/AbiGii toxin family protein [Listeria monocytogenes]EAG6101154.1 nucleotidyl transferase AbiEii/AbiGii toxin family protein [Listeria monocytogenes]EKZ1598890.1 nucleotidyl transferase AbiEii/AbiGii toxin family protein [Listeria monocytogenes]EKZ1610649.1 nucleotidyl transferase AbiEii/AbiGii toxin family protein [Listeria monocytogenes]EKZ1627945.1 nucleotidyl tra
MILERSLTTEWYDLLKQDYKNPDRNLLDKVAHAFYLLEKLTDTSLKFVFKGGTCLLLLLQEMKRFSIDIDIIITENISENELSTALEKIVETSLFTHFEEHKRYHSAIPKAHFKFFYTSPLDGMESYILLDILFEKSPYTQLIELSIESPFIETSLPNKTVIIPDIENILGDKLTAFAPNTTGIPYGKGKEMEIIKQLFDIESLFNQSKNLTEIKTSFTKCAEQELNYRELHDKSPKDVLEDILKTACILGGRGSHENETFLQLQDGISRIKAHIINRNYIVEEAVISASKAAYLASLLKSNRTKIEHFDSSQTLPELVGKPLFKKMGKIIKFSPEAHYYFAKAQELNQ